MEAGNRCFDERVPEEVNRRIVDHVSDINMPYTEHARRNLLGEGLRPETIIKTGSPMREILNYYAPKIAASGALDKLGLKRGDFFLVSAHREENIDDPRNFDDLLESLAAVAEHFNKRVIVSTHPRTRKRIESRGRAFAHDNVQFLKAMGFMDYVKLQQSAYCVLSDSGTLTEESSILGFPGVMIRPAHERPEGMDEGSVVMSGLKPEAVISAIELTIQQCATPSKFRAPADYDADNISLKVVRTIVSYTEYVNRTVWRK
jgi:UDP-N-acetylglucosamine 2-epimerase (non-hydrolysing)